MGNDSDSRRDARIGGVLGPTGGIGIPAVRTLSGEYRDTPEPNDSDRVPTPAPASLGRRVMDRLATVLRPRNAGER